MSVWDALETPNKIEERKRAEEAVGGTVEELASKLGELGKEAEPLEKMLEKAVAKGIEAYEKYKERKLQQVLKKAEIPIVKAKTPKTNVLRESGVEVF